MRTSAKGGERFDDGRSYYPALLCGGRTTYALLWHLEHAAVWTGRSRRTRMSERAAVTSSNFNPRAVATHVPQTGPSWNVMKSRTTSRVSDIQQFSAIFGQVTWSQSGLRGV